MDQNKCKNQAEILCDSMYQTNNFRTQLNNYKNIFTKQ